MPTAQEILDSIVGINGFTVDTLNTEFKQEKMTAIICTLGSTAYICQTLYLHPYHDLRVFQRFPQPNPPRLRVADDVTTIVTSAVAVEAPALL